MVALADGEAQDDGGIQPLSTNDGYYYIDDSSYGLLYYLGQAASNGYTKVHVGTSFSDSGTVTIPSSLTEIAGYSEGFFSQGPKTVSIGYVGALSFVIPSGSDVSIDRVNFYAKSDDGGRDGYRRCGREGEVLQLRVLQNTRGERRGNLRGLHIRYG